MLITTSLAALALTLIQGLSVVNVLPSVAVCAVALAVPWQRTFLRAMAALVAFATAYAVLMEAVASTSMPLVDHWLAAADALLGLDAAGTVAFIDQYPLVATAFKLAYASCMPQTCLLIVVLHENPWTFLRRFAVGALITVCCFYFLPAEGVSTSITSGIAERFYALRAGTVLDPQAAQGIITFPSFHTIWAWLLIVAFWPTRLRYVALALNIAMIASTVTCGGHYYVDVLAGSIVAAILIRYLD